MRHPWRRLSCNRPTCSKLASSSPSPPVALPPMGHRGQRARQGCRPRSFPPLCHPTTPLPERNRHRARQVQRPLPRRLPTTSVRHCSRGQHPRSRVRLIVVVGHWLFEQARCLPPADPRGVERSYRRFVHLSRPALPPPLLEVRHLRLPRHQSRLPKRLLGHPLHLLLQQHCLLRQTYRRLQRRLFPLLH